MTLVVDLRLAEARLSRSESSPAQELAWRTRVRRREWEWMRTARWSQARRRRCLSLGLELALDLCLEHLGSDCCRL